MSSVDDIVLDEWERARAQIRSGIKTLYVLGMRKGAVIDDVIGIWDEESDVPPNEREPEPGYVSPG